VRCVRDSKTTLHGWLLACAVVVAIFARLYFASRPEIGRDDAISACIAALPFAAMLKFVIWNDPNMVLYYVLLHFWSAIAGNSPLALRMLSILFSVAAVPAIYLLGRRLFNPSVGLTAAFLLATNATAVDYAQIIRSYSLVILLVVASSFFFVKLIVLPKAKATDSWPYIIASTLAVYTHMHATFTLIAHALSACFRRAAPWRTLIASGVIVGLAVLPLPLLNFGNYQGQYDWVTQVHLQSMAKIVPFLSGAPLFQKTPSAIVLTLSSIALAGFGALAADSYSPWSRAFTVNGLMVPLGLCALLSLVKPAFFGESRYLLICLPFLVLLVALGIGAFRRPLIILCTVMVLEIWQVALRPLYYETPVNRTYWSEATDYIFSNARPGDGVVAGWTYDAWLYWYYEALHDKNHTQLHLAFPDWDAESFSVNGVYVDNIVVPLHPSAEWFDSEGPKFERLWIIVDPYHDSTTDQLLASARSLHIETQRTFPDGLKVILSVRQR
jgi:mannosyltransferase